MRELSKDESFLIKCFAEKLDINERNKLLNDIASAIVVFVSPDYSRIIFEIPGREKPNYCGQHLFKVEGKMLDVNGMDITVLLYADENENLLELEFVGWGEFDTIRPRWDTLKLH